MKPLHFFSSGGVGDALIVGLKIKQIEALGDNALKPIIWDHYERHEQHSTPIKEIMNEFIDEKMCTCHVTQAPEVVAKEECKKVDGIYLNTKIMGVANPYLFSKIGQDIKYKWKGKQGHVIIQESAGRLDDSSRRKIGVRVTHQIAEYFSDRRVIIIGGKYVHYTGDDVDNRILNMTGKTPSIINTFSLINNCSLYVGQDGVCAYYAMMQRKPAIVHYHIPDLISHYFNQEWAYHTIALAGGGNLLEEIDMNNVEIKTLLEIAKGM